MRKGDSSHEDVLWMSRRLRPESLPRYLVSYDGSSRRQEAVEEAARVRLEPLPRDLVSYAVLRKSPFPGARSFSIFR